jgi:hypothetical protein
VNHKPGVVAHFTDAKFGLSSERATPIRSIPPLTLAETDRMLIASPRKWDTPRSTQADGRQCKVFMR